MGAKTYKRKKSGESTPKKTAPPKATPPRAVNRLLVGDKLLGSRPKIFRDMKRSSNASLETFEPIITPEIRCPHKKKSERYILLPHSKYITVLAYKTGVKVATLVPSTRDEPREVLMECFSLVRYQRKVSETTIQNVLDQMDTAQDDSDDDEVQGSTTNVIEETLVMVGCNDGSLREFSLQALTTPSHKAGTKADFGSYSIAGPIYRPRRVVKVLKNHTIQHLTIPHLPSHQVRPDGILVYVVSRRVEKEKNQQFKAICAFEVIRVLVPHYGGSKITSAVSMRTMDKFKPLEDKTKRPSTLTPFRLLSTATPANNQDISVFVVVAKQSAIQIHYDQLQWTESPPPFTISMPSNNRLTAIQISLNKADITCGHHRGNICVLNNILKDVEQYHVARRKEKQLHKDFSIPKSKAAILPPDPRKTMITTRVHWHALPVSSIVYDSTSYPMDPLLYSGGEESVLVTWQISQGRDRPVQVHPRMALGGIVHLASCDRCDENPTTAMLVYSEDNSLQLLESHNKGRLWKIQGLATTNTDGGISLEKDPRSSGQKNSQLVLTGLSKAPGYMHWFDPTRERLASSLEVVPFNRISRNEPEDSPLPTPTITGHVFSKNGQDLITIDESPTENTYIGAHKDKQGTVGTIRFWSWKDSSSTTTNSSPPYQEIASMTFPHGPKNRISALTMSQDGSMACTVSANEKSFRVWEKSRPQNNRRDETDQSSSSWACKYKVKVPAGLSNGVTNRSALTFSEDNSLLAIAFDTIGSIWDTDGGRLLTTFDHSNGSARIETLRFVSPGVHQDLLLIQSKKCVSLRSPYSLDGSSGSFEGWSWSIPPETKWTYISAVELVESHECIAISVSTSNRDTSSVVLIDVKTGKKSSSTGVVKNLEGSVRSLCAVGKPRAPKSNWDVNKNNKNHKPKGPPLMLYALMSTGELVLCTEDSSYHPTGKHTSGPTEEFVSAVPRLDISPSESRRKRPRTSNNTVSSNTSEELQLLRPKRLALDVFGFGSTHDSTLGPSTAELPSLSSNFVKTFLGRNLTKSNA